MKNFQKNAGKDLNEIIFIQNQQVIEYYYILY